MSRASWTLLFGAVLGALNAGAVPLRIYTHTADADGFVVSSHAVASEGEILVVDTQMTLAQSAKFIAGIRQLEGKVTTIFITHPHPDHYFGLAALRDAFPDAKLVAMPDTVAAIAAEGPKRLKYYREQFMAGALAPNLPTAIPKLEKLRGTSLKVGKSQLDVLTFPAAEVKSAHALINRGSGALIAGDLVYDKTHLWLADEPPEKWIDALIALREMAPKKIYAGHGEPGGPELLKENIDYLVFFQKAKAGALSAEDLAQQIKVRFPDHRAPMIVDLSARKYFPSDPEPSHRGR